MKKHFFKTLSLVAMLVFSIALFAVPADKTPVTVRQPNGKMLTFILQGDERINWAKTIDGFTLLHNTEGNWCYAYKDNNGDLMSSNLLASNPDERNDKEIKFLSSIEKGLFYSDKQVNDFLSVWKAGKTPVKAQKHFPAKGNNKLLVVLVSFSDLQFTSSPTLFKNMCSQVNYNGTGSIRDYFLINSNGLLDLDIDVVGPVTLPNPMATYGNTSTYQKASLNFVKDAVNKVKDSVNLAEYDNDGDGYIDDIAFIFAGTPESTTGNPDEIWPHSGTIEESYGQSNAIKINTTSGVKRVNRYTCSAEKNSPSSTDATIGTFCHEFGHALGLPDEYDTDYGGYSNGSTITSQNCAVTTANWSVMCEGSYNNNSNSPCLWSAGQKIRTGWMDTIIVLDTPQDSIILPLMTGMQDTAYRINLNNNEFLIIEQRKQHGFDTYIPGNGLLIYHGQMNKINPWLTSGTNKVNTDPNDRGWYIECADGVDNKVNQLANHIGTASASFPGSANVSYFTNTSPNNAQYINGDPMNIAITDIHYVNDSVMMFNFNSSLPQIRTENVSGSPTNSSFNAKGTILYISDQTDITSKGFVYSTDENNFPSSNIVLDATLSDTFNINATITGLQTYTQYFYKAFVTTSTGKTIYGDVKTVTTQDGVGIVSTQTANNITENSATLRGTLIFSGYGTFESLGFVYTTDATITSPSLTNTTVIPLNDNNTDYHQYTYSLNNLQQGVTYYYWAFTKNSYGVAFGSKQSFMAKYPDITNNTISNDQQICSGTPASQLTGQTPSGGFGNFTYQWQQKIGYGSWTDADGENTNQNYTPTNVSQTTQYRRVVTSNGLVNHTSNVVTITVRTSIGGTISSPNDVYEKGANATLTLNGYSGTIIQWEKHAENAEFEVIPNITTKQLQQTFDEQGVFSYRVKVQINDCEPAYSNIKVITVNDNAITDVDALQFNISPNPINNGLLHITSDINQAQSIIITNTLGQVVYSNNNIDITDTIIDIENLKVGTYMITVIANNKLTTKKIIIN